VSTTLSCWSSRIDLEFLAIESASVQIANHASALTTSTVVLLACCKNSASPALRAMSITSSAVGVVLRYRNCISSHLTVRANSKSWCWTTLSSKIYGRMFSSCHYASVSESISQSVAEAATPGKAARANSQIHFHRVK
jgi:hypothetical protein